MAGRKIRDAEDARACLDAVDAAGLERAEWARANGIDGRSLNAWRLNLERPRRRQPAGLRLVELVPEVARAATVGLRVSCGPFVVEVPDDFDEHALARLLCLVAAC